MNTLAVLLIVGSAVVGPIENHVTRSYCAAVGYCSNDPLQTYIINDYSEETLPQLCERAMREVGARDGEMWVSKHRPIVIGRTTNGTIEYDPQERVTVRCVPVPQGYKR